MYLLVSGILARTIAHADEKLWAVVHEQKGGIETQFN
jgi:hypothetical protein